MDGWVGLIDWSHHLSYLARSIGEDCYRTSHGLEWKHVRSGVGAAAGRNGTERLMLDFRKVKVEPWCPMREKKIECEGIQPFVQLDAKTIRII